MVYGYGQAQLEALGVPKELLGPLTDPQVIVSQIVICDRNTVEISGKGIVREEMGKSHDDLLSEALRLRDALEREFRVVPGVVGFATMLGAVFIPLQLPELEWSIRVPTGRPT